MDPDKTKCDFCWKEFDNKALVSGHNATICENCINICSQVLNSIETKVMSDDNMSFITPLYIRNHLDKYIIGQEKAKKVLAVAVYNHYKRLRTNLKKDPTIVISKNNILLIGPTGSGKTYLAETLAKILDVPFGHSDATTLSEAGYVGDDVEKVLYDLLKNAKMNVTEAEKGIVYIDEIDKIGRKEGRKGVSDEGVQRGLLKLLEGTIASVPLDGKRNEVVRINTANILFILGGAFDGLTQLLKNRLQPSSIGFTAQIENKDKEVEDKLRQKVSPEDIIKFGFMPEFIGRVSTIATLNTLTINDLCDILIKPENALTKQYQELFALDGVALTFTEKSLVAIAALALERKTGARGLKAILETVLMDDMFNAPTLEVKAISVSESMVKDKCGG